MKKQFIGFSLCCLFFVSFELLPDEPFHNFRASKSVDRRMLCNAGTSLKLKNRERARRV